MVGVWRNLHCWLAPFLYFLKNASLSEGWHYHPLVWWFARRTHRTRHIVILMHGYDLLQPKEKVHWSVSERNQAQASRVLSYWSHILDSSSNELWQVWNVANQWSFLEAQHPGFLLGGGREGTLCLAYIKITQSQKKSRCSA